MLTCRRWWHAALRGAVPPVTESLPQPGCFDMRLGFLVAPILAALLASSPAAGEAPTKPKFGPLAVSILVDNAFLRRAPAPDYWTLSAFYLPQLTSSDCSAAAAAMAVNALRGLPEAASEPVVTEKALLARVADPRWSAEAAEGGPGVTFDGYAGYLAASLGAFGLDATVEAVQPADAAPEALARFRDALRRNEASGENVVLVYFNQGVLTGDWDGPHISPVGAYDEATDRVLVMDVDREWYVPYWTPAATLLAGMAKATPTGFGPLSGGRGGYYVVGK